MSVLLGCIADDFTGATDLASTLVSAGMRVAQIIGVPVNGSLDADVNAVVVALKTRALSPHEAVSQSLAALRWLQAQRAHQIYFKYCSTFDSVFAGEIRGNIGPVTDALMDELDCPFTVATPAFPDNGRTVYQGHLFVGTQLLSDSGMRHHPLTPMTDPNLVRVLQAQSRRAVCLVDHAVVARGTTAIRERIATLREESQGIAIVDAISNDDLLRIGTALEGMPLVTGGSGLAAGLPGNFGIVPSALASKLPASRGALAIVSGSCSQATQAQVADFIDRGGHAHTIDPLEIAAGTDVVTQALSWAKPLLGSEPVLIYSTAEPTHVLAAQHRLGLHEAGTAVESAIASIAKGLVEQGVRKLVVAGGETAGACVQVLSIEQMQVGPQIAPGVPWCHARSPYGDGGGLHIALKSGNFGGVALFTDAFAKLL